MISPKLSIIIPVYNAEKYLKRCLDSVMNQSFLNWECFLINDGSTDRSGAICESFAVQDERFHVVHKYNAGPANARNLGIFLSKGEWISFIDADDWIESDRYSIAISKGEESNVSIVQCAIKVWENGKNTKLWHLGDPGVYTVDDNKILSDPVYDIGHCWDKIYKSSLIKDNNIWFPDCDLFEDTLFNTRLYFTCGKILSIGNPLYNYNINTGSLAHSKIDSTRKLNLIRTAEESISKMSDTSFFNENLIRNFFDNAINLKCGDSVDYVFPYVDSSKSQWIKEYNQNTKGEKINSEVNGVARFRTGGDLLKYKFRAIEKWMPWINTIHMIVSDMSQVPDWIDTDKIHIVLHKDIIPAEYLPTFNSCTIEMFLHNIFGLSEKFIYSNDDMFPNYKLVPKFYFMDGKVKANLFNRRLYDPNDINQVWAKIPENSLKLAAKDAPQYIKKYIDGVHLYEPQHIGKPMLRSVNKQVFNLYKNEILDSISQFREGKNLNQYLFTEYALFHNMGSFETFKFKYYVIKPSTIIDICKDITETDDDLRTRVICCNDGELATDKMFDTISMAFEQEYPDKCKYEK